MDIQKIKFQFQSDFSRTDPEKELLICSEGLVYVNNYNEHYPIVNKTVRVTIAFKVFSKIYVQKLQFFLSSENEHFLSNLQETRNVSLNRQFMTFKRHVMKKLTD